MRQREFPRPHADSVVKDQINIQRARRIPPPVEVAAQVALQPLQPAEQCAWQQAGLGLDGTVQIAAAAGGGHRNRQPVGRYALDLRPEAWQRRHRGIKNLAAGASIGSQQQINRHAGNSPD